MSLQWEVYRRLLNLHTELEICQLLDPPTVFHQAVLPLIQKYLCDRRCCDIEG